MVVSPENYFDILHSMGNAQRNVKDKLFRLGRPPHVPIWWDVKHIKIVKAAMLTLHLPSEAGESPEIEPSPLCSLQMRLPAGDVSQSAG